MPLTTAPRVGKVATAITNYNYAIAMAVAGNMVYVGEYSGKRLTILDVSNPRAPRLRGQLAATAQITDVATAGGHVYLTGLGGHLQVVNVSNPASPASVASVAGNGWSVAAAGANVYVTSLSPTGSRLHIYDVSNPASPALKSETVITTGFSDIQVIGTVAYTLSRNYEGGNWLQLYDVSNPSAPTLTSSVSLGSTTARCFTTDGVHACIGIGDGSTSSRLAIYDVSNPAATPVAKGSLAVHGIPSGVTRVGSSVYLTFFIGTTGVQMLDTIDVSDVMAPALSEYTSLGREDGVVVAHVSGHLLIPGRQFDVYATQADLGTATLRVSAGIMVDSIDRSSGGLVNGLTFGAVSGEGISSQRTVSGGNPFGIDFYTAFQNRLAITNGGRVGIGHTEPQYQLQVNGSVAGAGAYLNVSDGRYKEHLAPVASPVERLRRLHGVTFEWNRSQRRDLSLPSGRQLGLVAQEVESVFPEAVTTADDGTKSVAYSTLIPVLIEAIKQQQVEIDALRAVQEKRSRPARRGIGTSSHESRRVRSPRSKE